MKSFFFFVNLKNILILKIGENCNWVNINLRNNLYKGCILKIFNKEL